MLQVKGNTDKRGRGGGGRTTRGPSQHHTSTPRQIRPKLSSQTPDPHNPRRPAPPPHLSCLSHGPPPPPGEEQVTGRQVTGHRRSAGGGIAGKNCINIGKAISPRRDRKLGFVYRRVFQPWLGLGIGEVEFIACIDEGWPLKCMVGCAYRLECVLT